MCAISMLPVLNLLWIPSRANPFSGINLTTSSEMATRQIQTTGISIFNIHENTSEIHQNKAYIFVNPAAVSDFKKALRQKQTMRLSEDSTPHTKP